MNPKRKEILFLKSDLTELNKLNSFILKFCEEKKEYTEKFNKILLCISEAVMNGIIHGNNFEKDKKVEVILLCFDRFFEVIVRDEGSGFDYMDLKNPTLKDNIKNENGRGIYIIKSYCEFVKFNKKGNEIHFKINLT